MPPTNPNTDPPESTLLEPPDASAESTTAEPHNAGPSTPPAAESPAPQCPPGCTHSRLSVGCVSPCHAAPTLAAGADNGASSTAAATAEPTSSTEPAGSSEPASSGPASAARSEGAGELAQPVGSTSSPHAEAVPAPARPADAPPMPVAWPDELSRDKDTRELTLALISQTARRVATFVEIQPEHPNAPGLLQGLAGIYQALHAAQQAAAMRDQLAKAIVDIARQGEATRAEILKLFEASRVESARTFGRGPYGPPPGSPAQPPATSL